MPLKQDRLDRSLKLAKTALESFEKKLDEQKVKPEERRKNPLWRELNASCKKIEARLESLADLISRSSSSENATAQ